MKTRTVYKVVRKTPYNTHYLSSDTNEPEWEAAYTIGSITRPRKPTRLLAFETLQHAQTWTRALNALKNVFTILECTTPYKTVAAEEYLSCKPVDFVDFWRGIYSSDFIHAPQGSLSCTSLTPVKLAQERE